MRTDASIVIDELGFQRSSQRSKHDLKLRSMIYLWEIRRHPWSMFECLAQAPHHRVVTYYIYSLTLRVSP